jgi:hypothetical protein
MFLQGWGWETKRSVINWVRLIAGNGLSQSAGVGQDVPGYCNGMLRCAENNENNNDFPRPAVRKALWKISQSLPESNRKQPGNRCFYPAQERSPIT